VRLALLLLALASIAGAEDAAPERLRGVDPQALTATYAPGGFSTLVQNRFKRMICPA